MASSGNEGQGSSGYIIQENSERTKLKSERSTSSNQSGVKYGVKNYLHHFYEDCTGMGQFDDDPGHLIKDTASRYTLLYRIGFIAAAFFIVLGIILLLLGFVIPDRKTKFIQDGIIMINSNNVRFNKFLTYSRWVGASSFCFGGIVLSICIVLIGLGKIKRRNELIERKLFEQRLHNTSSEGCHPSRGTDEFGNLVQYGACGSSTSTNALSARTPVPTSLKEVTKVQPA